MHNMATYTTLLLLEANNDSPAIFYTLFEAVQSLASATIGSILGRYRLTNLLSDRSLTIEEEG